jgi:hypothetical protein
MSLMNGQDELKITSRERELDLQKLFLGEKSTKKELQLSCFLLKYRCIFNLFATFLA